MVFFVFKHNVLSIGLTLVLLVLFPGKIHAESILAWQKTDDLPVSGLFRQGDQFYSSGQTDSALMYYNDVVMREGNGRTGKQDLGYVVMAYVQMGNIHINQYHNYTKAYSCFREAIRIASHAGLKPELARCYLAMGHLYQVQTSVENYDGFNDTIVNLMKKSYHLAVGAQKWELTLEAVYNMIVLAYGRERFDRIVTELNDFYRLDIPGSEYLVLFGHGMECLVDKRYAEALSYFEKMKNVSEGSIQLLNYYSSIAECHYKSGNVRAAIAAMDSIHASAVESDNKWLLVQSLREYSDYWAKLGDKKKSDEYLFSYYKTKEDMLADGKLSQIKDMHFINELDEADRQVRELDFERAFQHRIIIGISVLAIVFALMLVTIFHAYHKLKKAYRDLYERNQQILRQDKESADTNKMLLKSIEASPRKYQSSQLTDTEKQEILIKIRLCMMDAELICSPDFNLGELSDKIGYSQRKVSQVINEKCNCNFSMLLAEYRIKEVCRRINELPEYRRMTIEAIGESVGISSRSYFASTFKRFVGLNPSEYIKETIRR